MLSVIGGIVFALLPWSTFGIATPVVFAIAAGVRRSWLLALATAGYSVAWVTMFTTTGAEDGSTADAMFTVGLLVIWLLGGTHAAFLSPRMVRALRHGHQPAHAPATPAPDEHAAARVAAETSAEMANDPVLRKALQRRTRRRLARDILAKDPELAADLGIGRPDLGRGFKDGGLIDVNAVPATVLSSLPGFDPAMAERVVAARERHGGLHSGNELVVHADVPNRVVDKLADRLLFHPPDD